MTKILNDDGKKNSNKKAKEVRSVDKKILSFFLLVFPSVILAASDNWIIKSLLLLYQAILAKQFIDDYYKYN